MCSRSTRIQAARSYTVECIVLSGLSICEGLMFKYSAVQKLGILV